MGDVDDLLDAFADRLADKLAERLALPRQTTPTTRADDYLPCVRCGKPIHPELHTPDARERGHCTRCRGIKR
jgi:hypothetical protein